MIEIQKPLLLLFHVVTLLWLLVLPKLNSTTATCPSTSEDVVGFETRRGGEERDDTDAECSGGAE